MVASGVPGAPEAEHAQLRWERAAYAVELQLLSDEGVRINARSHLIENDRF